MKILFLLVRALLVFIVLIILISVIWRLLSHRYVLPCPSWLSWLVELDNPFSTINRAETIIKHLQLKQGMVVLDVGCGPGRLTIPIARKIGQNGSVVAMDIQIEMIKKVQEKARSEHLTNIKFLNAGIGENKLEQNMFDRVLLVTVLGEIPNQQAAMKEIFNALKPGGILSITEIIFDPHFQRQNVVLHLADSIGFRKKELFGSWYAYTLHLEKPF